MLVVELIDENNEPMFGSSLDISLVESDNPNPDACKYAPGLLTRNFRLPVEAFINRYSMQTSDVFREFCSDCDFNRDGFYAVIIGQAERGCLTEGQSGPPRPRTYEVRYSRNGVERRLALKRENFFSLCTSAGKWSRIKPVRFKIETSESRVTDRPHR